MQLSADNTLKGRTLQTEPGRRAVYNDLTSATTGRLVLRDPHVLGRVEIVADGAVRGGHVEADGVHIEMADAGPATCGRVALGVEVVPGAWTLWNRQADPTVTVTAELNDLSAGRAGAPVRGSGIFVAGMPEGGRLHPVGALPARVSPRRRPCAGDVIGGLGMAATRSTC